MCMGGDGGSTNMYNGRLSCLRVFDLALTEQQITEIESCHLRE